MGRQLQRHITPDHVPRPIPRSFGTPEKQIQLHSLDHVSSTPQKVCSGQAAGKVLSTDTKAAGCDGGPLSWGSEHSVLVTLFAGIDRVSQIYGARNRRVDFSTLRHDVEDNTGKELSEVRFCQILALAAGGIKAHWIGSGSAAKLELLQIDEAGHEKAMTSSDMATRKVQFNAALTAAVEAGDLPSQPISPKPESKNDVHRLLGDSREPTEALPDLPSLPCASIGASAAHKMQSTLDRVRARQAAAQSPEALRYQELRRHLQICSDSIEVFSVMAGLFARRGGLTDQELDKAADAASEPELLKALCSAQAMRPMDAPAARSAVAHLASQADGWFQVEEGTHVVGAKYYRRFPNSSSANVLDRLKVERSKLEQEFISMTQPGTVGMLRVAPVASAVDIPHKAVSTGNCATAVKPRQGKRPSRHQEVLPSLPAPDVKRRRVGKQKPTTA